MVLIQMYCLNKEVLMNNKNSKLVKDYLKQSKKDKAKAIKRLAGSIKLDKPYEKIMEERYSKI